MSNETAWKIILALMVILFVYSLLQFLSII